MSGDDLSASEPPRSKKIKLVLKTSPRATPIDINPSLRIQSKDSSSSPPRPSYSPVTPTGSHEAKNLYDREEPKWMDKEPPALPVSLEENPDAIALRATISLLQMQRQQNLRDIRDLDKMRGLALDDPEAFIEDLKNGKLIKTSTNAISFDDIVNVDEAGDGEEQDSNDKEEATVTTTAAVAATADQSKFGRLPNPQNIPRCPPIEWSKYHIFGQPLDELHDKQRRYPGVGEKDFARNSKGHEIAAPYRLFGDKLASERGYKG